MLILKGQSVDTRRKYHLDCGWHLDGFDSSSQAIAARFPLYRLGLHQRPDGLLQEERVALIDQELLEGCQSGISTQQRIEQPAAAFSCKRVQWELAVVSLARPAMVVFGPIGEQQQDACRPQALNQAVEHRLRLAVDPMQVFEN